MVQSQYLCLTLRHRGQAPSHIDRIPLFDRRGYWQMIVKGSILVLVGSPTLTNTA